MNKIIAIVGLAIMTSGCGAFCSTLEQIATIAEIMGETSPVSCSIPDIDINIPDDDPPISVYPPYPGPPLGPGF